MRPVSVRSLGLLDKRLPLEERFWNRVEKSEDCWVWVGSIASFGYGVLKVPDET